MMKGSVMNNGIVQYKPRTKYIVEAVKWLGDNIQEVEELVGAIDYDYSDGFLRITQKSSTSYQSFSVERNDMIVKFPDGTLDVLSPQKFDVAFVEDRDCY